ncbi:multidrug and toxin extrusion protein 1-like [Lineus longissimus]|uniref:multidrug and toxin extrusion protein 1-like n=1 Tax=Lineus longissimus TaxID=88925 RepID=UPI00315D4AED
MGTAVSRKKEEDGVALTDDPATGYGATEGQPASKEEHEQTRLFDLDPWYFKEVRELLWLGGPLIVCMLLQFAITPISLMFCGRLTIVEFSAAALANTIILITGIYIGNGLTTACDTLFSQTFGAGNNKEIGLVLQRAMLIMLLCCLPCWALHLNTESILVLLGQEREICWLTGRYLRVFLPGLPANFLYQVLAKYLQNQNVVAPVIVVLFVGNITNALSHYLLVFQAGLDLTGSALSQVIAQYSLLITISLYIYISGFYKSTWDGWSVLAFTDWCNFLKYAIPGMVMVVLDSLCFEIGTFASGVLGEVVLGAQTTINQIDALFYQFLQGLAIACSIRVGQHLGGNHAFNAHRSARTSLVIGTVVGLVSSIFIVSFRGILPEAFTTNDDIVHLSSKILPITAVFQLASSFTSIGMGALRGCGRQTVGAAMGFVCFYVIGLPIALCLMFFTVITLAGYWWGIAVGFICGAVFILLYLEKQTDWDQEAKLARERAGVNGTNVMEYTTQEVDSAPMEEGEGDSETDDKTKLHRLPKEPVNWRKIIILRTINILMCVAVLGLSVFSHYSVTDVAGGYGTNMTLHHPGTNHSTFHGE